MTMPSAAPADAVDYIDQTRATYDKLGYASYQWAENPTPPAMAPLRRPLNTSRLTLIASGGIYRTGQVAFTHKDDVSLREIETTVDTSELRVTHFAYDQTDARRDPNVVFPIEALRTLVTDGDLGGLTSHALTFMGGIYSQRRLAEELIPRLARKVHEMETDIVLLVPV